MDTIPFRGHKVGKQISHWFNSAESYTKIGDASGKAMTAGLLAQAHHHMPRFAWPMMPTAFRYFLGDRVADMLALPPANSTRHIFAPMSAISRIMTRGKDTHRLHARFSAFAGRHLMNGILSEMRSGDRPEFEIPTHLADAAS